MTRVTTSRALTIVASSKSTTPTHSALVVASSTAPAFGKPRDCRGTAFTTRARSYGDQCDIERTRGGGDEAIERGDARLRHRVERRVERRALFGGDVRVQADDERRGLGPRVDRRQRIARRQSVRDVVRFEKRRVGVDVLLHQAAELVRLQRRDGLVEGVRVAVHARGRVVVEHGRGLDDPLAP
eukprot:30821-Pelagococcus_subviridis.AAC.2